jgi:hypothetical protein
VHQQVNLFQPLFRKERKLFSFVVSVQIAVVFILSLLVVYMLGLRSVDQTKSDLEVTKKQNAIHLGQLSSLTQTIKDRDGGVNVNDRISLLQKELEAERYMLKVLGQRYTEHRQGFSGYLEGFARRSIQGMWITAFEMKNGGQSVQISGGTVSPEIIPDFLNGLSGEASLAGTTFEVLTMDRKAPNGSWIEYTLSSGDFTDSPFTSTP